MPTYLLTTKPLLGSSHFVTFVTSGVTSCGPLGVTRFETDDGQMTTNTKPKHDESFPIPTNSNQHLLYRSHCAAPFALPLIISKAITYNILTMSVVGVDFGAHHSVIAAAGRGGVDVILNGNSQRLNP